MRSGRNWVERNADVLALFVALILYFTGNVLGCTKPQTLDTKTAVETSLNLVADIVTPTIDLVRKACDAREGIETQQVRDGKQTSVQAAQSIAESRAQCDAVFKELERVRVLHNAAASAYESGALDEAHRKVVEARETYHEVTSELKELLR